MKKIILNGLLIASSIIGFGQAEVGACDFGLTATFEGVPHCPSVGQTFTVSVDPACPIEGDPIENVVERASFSSDGGIEIISQSGLFATVRMKSTPAQDGHPRYDKGRIIASYSCEYDSTYTAGTCGGGQTIDAREKKKKIGRKCTSIAQSFTWDRTIVGPKCVKENREVTYSVFDYVSGSVPDRDIYTWTKPTNWEFRYKSHDGSSETYYVNSVSDNDSVTVAIGECNSVVKTLLITNSGNIAAPTLAYQSCVSAWSSNLAVALTPVDGVTYAWDIVADGNGYTYAGWGNSAPGNINVNIGSATEGYILLKSSMVGQVGCPDTERVDTVRFTKEIDVNGATVSGPTCLEVGNTYQYSVNGIANDVAVMWNLPTGMEITSTDVNASTISAVVNSTSLSGGITASIQTGNCATGTIAGLYDIKIAPSISNVITGPTCITPGSNVVHSVSATNADSYAWTMPTGLTGSTWTTAYNSSVSNNFAGGTISVVAKKQGCPDAGPVTLEVAKSPAGVALSSLTANKTCLNNGFADVVTLTTEAGFDSYTWTLPAGWSINGATGTATTSSNIANVTTDGSAGSVSVVGTNSCGTSDAATISLTADGAGTLTVSSVETNGFTFLTANENIGAAYQWYLNGVAITGETTRFIALSIAGTTPNDYCVKATLVGGCSSQACVTSTYERAGRAAKITNVETTEEVESNVFVTPNPVADVAQISHDVALEGVDYIVTDMSGVKVSNGKFGANTTQFNTTNWSNGVYVVYYVNNGNVNYKKFVVKK